MPYQYKAKLKKVIDGDTLLLDIDLGFNIVLFDQYVRLSGIDAPESKSKDRIEKAFGLLSKAAVEEFIKESKNEIIIETTLCDNNDDKYGRILAKLYDPVKTCLNDWLIEHRFAVPYDGTNKQKLKELHSSNRKYLIDNKIIDIN
jgi:micrococcal nuclease